MASGTLLTFTYEGYGNRTTKAVAGGMTASFTHDTNRTLPVLHNDGDQLYVWALGNKIIFSIRRSNTADVWVYHRDGVESIPAVTDAIQNRAPMQTIGTCSADSLRTDASPG